jgi:2-(1,2-epoxy-1,2-dihydrophenyl)acetyl-CoA isomerase
MTDHSFKEVQVTYKAWELLVEDGLARLIMNQAEIGNPLNEVACEEFALVANEIAGRSDIRAILLQARGKIFSVGGDVKMFAGHLDDLPAIMRRCTVGLHMGITRLMRQDAPIVVDIHATAVGGAVAIAANCDVVVCARSAKLAAAYGKIGVTCDLGATVGLASRMGMSRARRYLLRNEVLDAQAAFNVGLIDEIAPDGESGRVAEAIAREFAQGPTRTIGEVRRLMLGVQSRAYEAQLEDEAQALARASASQDIREGITAFIEGRAPVFLGR